MPSWVQPVICGPPLIFAEIYQNAFIVKVDIPLEISGVCEIHGCYIKP